MDKKEPKHTTKRKEHKSFIDLTVNMLSSQTLPYYAEFNTFLNYWESTHLSTCGVNVSKHGMNFYYNPKWVDSHNPEELLFIFIHEDFHLLFDHQKRSIYYNKEMSNIVQDMIINQIIHDEIMSSLNAEKNKNKLNIQIPKQKDEFILDKDGNQKIGKDGKPIKNPYFGRNNGLFIPAEYDGVPIFENLYEWIMDKYVDYKKRKAKIQKDKNNSEEQSGNDSSQSGGSSQNSENNNQSNSGSGDENNDQNGTPDQDIDKDGFGNPKYGKYGKNGVECQSLDSIFDSLDNNEKLTLDTHIDDEVSDKAKKTIVRDAMERLKNRGLQSADVESILHKLRIPKKDYLREIKKTLSHHVIGTIKKKSITKPNRRGIEGLKGKKKYKTVINVILDTSGSMCGDFEKVLSYIYQNDIHINLIQIDTEVKVVEEIKTKSELQKLIIKGHGGTKLQPAIDFIADSNNNLDKYNSVILTDGYTDTLDFTNVKVRVLILTTAKIPNIIAPIGNVKSIAIDVDKSLHS